MHKQLLFAGALVLIGSMGFAQSSPETRTLVSGDAENGFLFAPDFKFTDVAGDFANLAGGYGGWVIDRRFLIGGGAYTLTNGSDGVDMTYGGGVFEYFVNQDSLVNVSVRGLVGGGSATLGVFRIPGIDIPGFGRGGGLPSIRGLRGLAGNFGIDLPDIFDDDLEDLLDALREGELDLSSSFFVAEPEVNVIVNISETIRLGVGGGYRFIGGAGRLNESLDGFTASAALKFTLF